LKKKFKSFISILIILILSFFVVTSLTKKHINNLEISLIKKIENNFNKLKIKLKTSQNDDINKEYWKNGKIIKWKGEILGYDIEKLPQNQFFLINNDKGVFLGHRENSVVKYIKILNYDIYTYKVSEEKLLSNIKHKNLIDIEYIDISDTKLQQFLLKNFDRKIKEEKNQTKAIIKNEKQRILILVKIENLGKKLQQNIFNKKIYNYLYLYFFALIIIWFIVYRKIDLTLLFFLIPLKLIQLLFLSDTNILSFIFPYDSFLGALSWLIILTIILLKTKHFISFIVSTLYSLIFLNIFFNKKLPVTTKTVNLIPILILISFFLTICILIKFKTKKYILLFLFIIIISLLFFLFYEINTISAQNQNIENSIKQIKTKNKNFIKHIKNTINLIDKKSIKELTKSKNSSLILFEKFFMYKIINRKLPSIAFFESEKVISYFSLVTPLPQIPENILKKTKNKWNSELEDFTVRGFKLKVDCFHRKFKINDKIYKILIFFKSDIIESANNVINIKKKNKLIAKHITVLKIKPNNTLKRLQRKGKYFTILKDENRLRGVFFNLKNEQFFVGFPKKNIFYYTADFIRINSIFWISLIISMFFYKRKTLWSSSVFRINSVIAIIPITLSIVLQVTSINFLKHYNQINIKKQNIEKADYLKKISSVLNKNRYTPKEICFYLHNISSKTIIFYENRKLNFFSGPLDIQTQTIPYEISRLFNYKSLTSSFYKNNNESIYFFYLNNKDKIFAILFNQRNANNIAYLNFINNSLFYSFIITILAILTGFLLTSKIKAGISKIIKGLNSVKDGRLQEIGTDKSGEIKDIIQSFNLMVSNIKTQRQRIKDLTEKEALLKIARKAAHEIKNPLTPTKLNIEHLYSLWKTDKKEFEKQFEKIMKATIDEIKTMENVVKDFLNFSKIGKPPLKTVNIYQFFLKIINIFKGTGIDFTLEGKKNIYALTNETYLETVIKNIILNSIEAMEKNKKIDIKLKSSEEFCEIYIRDYGKGIKKNNLEKIFKSGFSTKKGSGLGLSIVKEIISKLDGKLSILSWENEGTMVIIKIKKGEYNE